MAHACAYTPVKILTTAQDPTMDRVNDLTNAYNTMHVHAHVACTRARTQPGAGANKLIKDWATKIERVMHPLHEAVTSATNGLQVHTTLPSVSVSSGKG